ncbi:MAG: lipoyltransferase [Paramuribaculum sp.]|nr:lipoyltransferase [Paramuribaculum sp.]
MIYAQLPAEGDHIGRPLPFYLAMEEWLARREGTESYFFMWQVDPTVICGRHQDVELETDLDFCRSHGIRVVRRKSGGGCVYADRNNIMMSYITPSADVVTTFGEYTSGVAAMLRSLGLDARADTSRNDVLIGGRKVSGNAFYHLPGRSIVHGTMLYDADPEMMSGAITPSRAKMQSKGVKSVESRITTVKEHSAIGLEEFKRAVRGSLCGDRTLRLTNADTEEIERMSEEYFADSWLYRRRSRRDAGRRIEGIGEIRPRIITDDDGLIERVELSGDFFAIIDPESGLLERLKGVRPDREAIAAALKGYDASRYVAGLTTEVLLDVICEGI